MDSFLTEILIGGHLPVSAVQPLAQAIAGHRLRFQGESFADEHEIGRFLSRWASECPEQPLHLTHDGTTGKFPDVARTLREHGMHFLVWENAKYEFDGRALRYLPDLDWFDWFDCRQDGTLLLSKTDLVRLEVEGNTISETLIWLENVQNIPPFVVENSSSDEIGDLTERVSKLEAQVLSLSKAVMRSPTTKERALARALVARIAAEQRAGEES